MSQAILLLYLCVFVRHLQLPPLALEEPAPDVLVGLVGLVTHGQLSKVQTMFWQPVTPEGPCRVLLRCFQVPVPVVCCIIVIIIIIMIIIIIT